jgi:hypothetical protein
MSEQAPSENFLKERQLKMAEHRRRTSLPFGNSLGEVQRRAMEHQKRTAEQALSENFLEALKWGPERL